MERKIVFTILAKIDREGMPPAGVLKRWKMVGSGCQEGFKSQWCEEFERAMACTNNCLGAQWVSSSENY